MYQRLFNAVPRGTLHHAARPAARRLRGSLAVAAGCALAGAAQAQPATAPGLQLFGQVDAAVGRFAGPATGINAQDRATTRMESSALSTSHWGVRGSEALGGGATAVFELSSFIRNDTGALGRSDALPAPVNVAGDPVFSRAAWVGLAHPVWGRVRLGNISTQLFIQSISTNAFGDSTVFGPINLLTFIGGPLTGGTSWANSVVYDSPMVAGFSGSLAYALSERQGGGNQAARLQYAKGPVAASVAYQNVRRNPQTFADGTSPNDTRTWQLAASYDFGSVKLMAHLGRIQNRGTSAAPLDAKYNVWDLSAAVPVGAGTLLAGYGTRRTSDAVAPVPATVAGGNLERKVLTLGYTHALSKRTDLYALAMRDDTRTRTLGNPPAEVGAQGNSFAVGMRHRF